MRTCRRSATSGTVSQWLEEIGCSSDTEANRTLAAVKVTATDPMQGALLEQRYRIQGKIAQGGMAAVYEAFDERLERTVAVKVLHPSYAADPIFASRFMREARAAAALNHPHIVAVFDEGRHGNTTFLVMEKVDGTTLRGVLQQRVRLSPAEAMGVMEPVLAALAQAHDRGIAHRDVKPENVLISPTGIVKVADFGLARAVESSHQLTNRNTLLGTVAYLAPEQIADGQSDARSDVYAAGVMLYELLTGVKPYQGKSAIDVAYQHVNSDLPRPSTAVPELPSALDELVTRATRRDRNQRLATAGAFLADLRQTRHVLGIIPALVKATIAGPEPPTAPSADATPPDPRPWENDPAANTHARAAAVAALPAAAPASGGTSVMPALDRQVQGPAPAGMTRGVASPGHGGSTAPPYPPPAEPDMTQHDRQRGKRRILILAIAGVVTLALLAGGVTWWLDQRNDVAVPQLVGLSKAEAEQAAADAGLTVEYGDPEFSDTVSEEVVLEQKPGDGERIDPDEAITVVLSRGPENRTVPSVDGKPEAEAVELLEAEQFEPVRSEEESQDVPKGNVIRTDPAGGTTLRVDSKVRLVISKGRGSTQVPDVAGLSRADAEALLADRGLTATFTTEASDEAPADSVIRQAPEPDATVEKGSEVQLVASSGPEQVDVPNVRGMTCRQAQAALEAVGLKGSCQGPDSGEVFYQTPTAGSAVAKGSNVRLFTFPRL